MAEILSEETRARIQEVAKAYPVRRSAAIAALRAAQEQLGWLSPEAVAEVGAELDLDPNGLYQLVTFYDMFYEHPVASYVLGVCNNLSCYLTGSDGLLGYLQEKLGIGPGETTADGVFTLRTVECLAACDRAPVMMVNEDYHEKLTQGDVDRLLAELRAKAGPLLPLPVGKGQGEGEGKAPLPGEGRAAEPHAAAKEEDYRWQD